MLILISSPLLLKLHPEVLGYVALVPRLPYNSYLNTYITVHMFDGLQAVSVHLQKHNDEAYIFTEIVDFSASFNIFNYNRIIASLSIGDEFLNVHVRAALDYHATA
jgi:hypothetical protein